VRLIRESKPILVDLLVRPSGKVLTSNRFVWRNCNVEKFLDVLGWQGRSFDECALCGCHATLPNYAEFTQIRHNVVTCNELRYA
jgi:hypothetical protein